MGASAMVNRCFHQSYGSHGFYYVSLESSAAAEHKESSPTNLDKREDYLYWALVRVSVPVFPVSLFATSLTYARLYPDWFTSLLHPTDSPAVLLCI